MTEHTWKIGDYAKPKKTIYDTQYRIVEVCPDYLVAEIVASPTHTRIHLDPTKIVPTEYQRKSY
jgi:hypothetical protein